MKTPIYTRLKELSEQGTIRFHMPGHKQKDTGMYFLKDLPKIDVTETFGTDNLQHPDGVIAESLRLIAKEYGARYSVFTANSSSGAMHIALATVTKPGDTILIQRNCHKCVYNGSILNALDVEYVYPKYEADAHVLGGVSPRDVEAALDRNPKIKAVVITYPTYFGICSNLGEIARIVHERGKFLVVDAAHGPHFAFSDEFPKSAISLGADLVVHSAHKTLNAFTQTSMLHVGTDRVDIKRLHKMMNTFQTTSPSYIFMQSVEAAVAYMVSDEGREATKKHIEALDEVTAKLKTIPGLYVYTTNHDPSVEIYDKDRSKIIFHMRGRNGNELRRELYEKYNILLEMADYWYALALVGVNNTREELMALYDALLDISKHAPEEEIPLVDLSMMEMEAKMSIRDAFYEDKEIVPLDEAAGRISGQLVIPYPPGIPLVTPGEVITEELVDYIKLLIEKGMDVTGMEEDHTALEVVKR